MGSGIYNELDSTRSEIRLLTVLPARTLGALARPPLDRYDDIASAPFGDTLTDPPVKCLLHKVSLDSDNPKYIALSYLWGPENPTKPIDVNGEDVKIRENLEHALRHIRQRDRPVIVWADAICINQSDTREKTKQILLMRRIYKDAAVLAWLGRTDDAMNAAVDAINEIGPRAEQMGIMTLTGPDYLIWRSPDAPPHLVALRAAVEGYGSEIFPTFPHSAWVALMGCEYWTRVWIIQEVSLPSDVLFVCGSGKFAFKHMASTSTILGLGRIKWSQSLNIEEVAHPTRGRPLRDILEAIPSLAATNLIGSRRKCREGKGHEPLASVLNRFLVNGSTPPRASVSKDMIWGFLAMASDTESLASHIDYNKTVAEIYTEATKWMLQEGDLRILTWAQQTDRPPGLPSWVPHFDRPIRNPCLNDKYDDFFSASGSCSYKSPSASDTLKLGPNVLSLICARVDTIKAVGVALAPTKDKYGCETFDYANAWIFMNDIDRCCMEAEREQRASDMIQVSLRNTGQSPFRPKCGADARWRVPCAGLSYSAGQRSRDATAIKEGYFQLRDFIDGLPGSAEVVQTPKCNNYEQSMECQYQQRPFVSCSGYVGLVPAASAPGDDIYIVLGSGIPFLFRKAWDGQCQLLGGAYVDGIMDGEFMLQSPKQETLYVI